MKVTVVKQRDGLFSSLNTDDFFLTEDGRIFKKVGGGPGENARSVPFGLGAHFFDTTVVKRVKIVEIKVAET